MYLNDVKLIGNLGSDAEVKTANNQNEYVILSVAVNESWKNKESGHFDTRTDWPRVVVWGKLTNFAKTLKKGERILVTGKLRTRDYDKQIGKGKSKTDVTIYVTEVHATGLQRMDPRSKDRTEHEAGELEGEAVPY
jgi:single-strand DNA-binding protein